MKVFPDVSGKSLSRLHAGLTLKDIFPFMAMADKEREGREGEVDSPHCCLVENCKISFSRLTDNGNPE